MHLSFQLHIDKNQIYSYTDDYTPYLVENVRILPKTSILEDPNSSIYYSLLDCQQNNNDTRSLCSLCSLDHMEIEFWSNLSNVKQYFGIFTPTFP